MDLVIRNARVFSGVRRSISAVAGGKIVAIERILPTDAPTYDAEGHLACAGLVETHIHLDKTRIIDRCPPEDGRNANAVPRVAAVKATFTEEDVYQRASVTLENCIKHGTTRMRTHVELDAGVEMRSFDALEQAPARLCLGDRHRILRVPAGGPDQQQALRRTAGRGVEARRPGDRRGAQLRSRQERPDPAEYSSWRANMTSTSTCISTPATARRTWTSIWSAN